MLDKYRELFEISVRLLFDEQERFTRIDQKATWYLATLSILVAGAGYFGNWSIQNLFPPKGVLEWLLLLFALVLYGLILVSWFLLFKVLRVSKVHKMPLTDEMIRFYNDHELIDIYYALACGNRDAYLLNVEIANRKSGYLANAYRLIVASIVVLVAFTGVFAASKWTNGAINEEETAMFDDQPSDPSENAPTESRPADATPDSQDRKPDPSVKPPRYVFLTEGYDPKRSETFTKENPVPDTKQSDDK